MKKIILISLCVIIVSISGCALNQHNNNKSQGSNVDISNNNTDSGSGEVESTVDIKEHKNTSNEKVENITHEDFNIKYKNTNINDTIPFKRIAKGLGFEIGKKGSNVEVKAMTQIGKWYVVHYPSMEEEDIRLEYIVNEQLGTEKLVSLDLYNVATFRGVSVDDDLQKLLHAYGDVVKPEYNSSTTDSYLYKLDTTTDASHPDKSISIIVDKSSKKVIRISINYYQNGAMEELETGNFD